LERLPFRLLATILRNTLCGAVAAIQQEFLGHHTLASIPFLVRQKKKFEVEVNG
jgi:hypothetical protein